MIIPAHWLKTITREGLGRGAFETLRADPDNLFDSAEFKGAPILIAGDNFGCGSSREHAAWALLDLGITAVIAPSFSDIFSGNAFKNGILTVVLPQAAIDRLMEVAQTDPVHIDLEHQTVTTPFQDRFTFEIDPFRKALPAERARRGRADDGARRCDFRHTKTKPGPTMPWLGQAGETRRMKALRSHAIGGPETLTLDEVDSPRPRPRPGPDHGQGLRDQLPRRADHQGHVPVQAARARSRRAAKWRA